MSTPNQSEEMLRLILESSPHAIVAVDQNGRIVLVNSLTANMFGYSAPELIGAELEILLPQRFHDSHVHSRAAFATAPAVRPMSARPRLTALHRDGTEFPVSVHLSPIHVQDQPLVIAWIANVSQVQAQETKLREFQELIAAVNKGIPGVVFRRPITADGTLVYTYFAGRLPEILNLTAEQVQNDPAALLPFVHPDDLPLVAQTLNPRFDDYGPRNTIFRIRTPKGELRWIQMQSFADTQPNGDVVRNGIILDVTDVKRAESALAESERRFRAMVDNVPGSVWQEVRHLDGSHAYTFMSEGFRDQTGWSPEELQADPEIMRRIYLPSEEWERESLALSSAIELSFRTREFRVRRKDGTTRWLRARSIPHSTSTGEVAWDGVTIDITEEKQREEALREAQRRLQSLTNNLPLVVFERVQAPGEEPKTVFVSSQVKELLGISPEEFLGKTYPLQRVMHPQDAARVVAGVKARTLSKEDWRDEFRVVLPTKEVRWIRGAARQYVQDNGGIVWDGVYMDITREKEARDASERYSQQTQSEMALAADLQRRFLWSARIPEFLQAATCFQPASPVSGDILFSKVMRQGDFFCFIGDATGHGVVAGLMTMLVVALLYSMPDELTPREILQRLNNQLESHKLEGRFVSSIALKIDQSGRLRIANAGHPAAVIFPASGEPATLVESGGTPLGWFAQQEYEETELSLSPGATLLLYTDGLSEWPNSAGVEFGAQAVLSVARRVRTSSPQHLLDALVGAATESAAGRSAPDDVSLVALRFLPPTRPAPGQ
jgi:PAS domain S-box-containing protein